VLQHCLATELDPMVVGCGTVLLIISRGKITEQCKYYNADSKKKLPTGIKLKFQESSGIKLTIFIKQ